MYKKGIINFSGCMKWAWGVAKFEKLQLEKRAEALVKINEANNPKQSTSIISIDDNILIGRAVAEAFKMKSYFR